MAKKTLTICPCCGKKFWRKSKYPWIGNGIPRFYCPDCEWRKQLNDPVVDEHNIGH